MATNKDDKSPMRKGLEAYQKKLAALVRKIKKHPGLQVQIIPDGDRVAGICISSNGILIVATYFKEATTKAEREKAGRLYLNAVKAARKLQAKKKK